ncbi:hypothetical protein ACF0H5_004979 [Mactra antiquata]
METIHFNKFLPNSIIGRTPYYTFDTLLKVDVQRCIKACQRTEVCKYINYETRYLRCSLLRRNENIDDGETSSSVVLETKPGQIFGNKSEWKKDYCQNVFGHLVDIESEDEQWFLSSLFDGKYSNTWTGGNDLELTGTYVWSDGTEMTYTYWNYKQPDYSDQHCVEIVHRLNEGRTGGWEDENCLSKGGSVCEIP